MEKAGKIYKANRIATLFLFQLFVTPNCAYSVEILYFKYICFINCIFWRDCVLFI